MMKRELAVLVAIVCVVCVVIAATASAQVEQHAIGVGDDAASLAGWHNVDSTGAPACAEFLDDFESYTLETNPTDVYDYLYIPTWSPPAPQQPDRFEVGLIDSNQVLQYYSSGPSIHFPQTGKLLKRECPELQEAGVTYFRTQGGPSCAALVFAWQDADNYYNIHVYWTNTLAIVVKKSGVWETLAVVPLWSDKNILDITPGFRIEVKREGDTLIASVTRLDTGAEKTLEVVDTSLIGGRVGFVFYGDWHGGMYVNIDDFYVRGSVFTLTVDKAGTGTGTVTSNPTGIDCGGDCTEIYDKDTVVTLTASPDANSVFAGWSGDADCSDGQVTMDADKTCTATFNSKPGTIIVEKQTDPDGDATDFTFTGDVAGTISDGERIEVSGLQPGTYTSQETVPQGWDLTSIQCDDSNSSGDLNTRTATFQLEAEETVICTFTNGALSVETATGSGPATFDVDAGVMQDLSAVAEGALTCSAAERPSVSFPHGFFSFKITGLTPCASQTVEVTLTLPDAVPQGAEYWKCQNGEWVQIPIGDDDGDNVITFLLTDGGQGDGDGTCNGEIDDPGGLAVPLGTIIVEKQTDPDGAAGSFTFSGDAAGAISDNGQIVVSDLDAGTYSATEADPGPDFELTNITCNDGDSTGNVGTRTATFNVDWGETVECTFTNTMRSLKVTKEIELPVGGLAAVDQIVRFLITVENDGGLTIDPLTLRDDYDAWCLRSRRAEIPPDLHGGSAGFLHWNDLGALAPGESLSLWVEFTAAHACEEATNAAIVQTGVLTFEDQATLRILETVARVGGFLFHDDNGDGMLNLPCRGTDVTPATCEPGLETATAETTLPSGKTYQYTTNTSGWYSFNLLDPGTYHVDAAPPAGSWWTPTTAEACDTTVLNNWDRAFCHFGYWWGLDGPPVQAAGAAENELTLSPTQDATISEWMPGNQGADAYLRVRQPGVTLALLQFDLSGLPEGAEVAWAKLRLFCPFASNQTNRLYMTTYPLDKMWAEDEATWLQAEDGLPWSEPGATGDHSEPVAWAWIDAPGWVEFDLDADLLAGWLADPGSNHGLLLRGEGSENREVAYWFFSREYVNADVHPQLVVGYDVP